MKISSKNYIAPLPSQLIELKVYLEGCGYESEDAKDLVGRSFIGVANDFITDCPGYAGTVMVVLWPGSGGNSMAESFGWDKKTGELYSLDNDGVKCEVVESSKQRIVTIKVKQIVEDDELDGEDLMDNIAGTYEVEVPADVSPEAAASIALDAFHTEVAISVLDHFEITTWIDGKEVAQSDDEGYAHEGEALSDVVKISEEVSNV